MKESTRHTTTINNSATAAYVETIRFARPLTQTQSNMQSILINRCSFPPGIAANIARQNDECAMRIWIVDNSVNMRETCSFTSISGSVSKWAEMKKTIEHQISLAKKLEITALFLLLHHPSETCHNRYISIQGKSENKENIVNHRIQAYRILDNVKLRHKSLPLLSRLRKVLEQVKSMSDSLHRRHKWVSVNIYMNGVPTDCSKDEVILCLNELLMYHVRIIFTIFSDKLEVYSFYNEVSNCVSVPSVGLMFSFTLAAQQAFRFNPWVNYTLHLHQFRELGFCIEALKQLTLRPLERNEVDELCDLLYDYDTKRPYFREEVDAFVQYFNTNFDLTIRTWNDVQLCETPLIQVHYLAQVYKGCNNIKRKRNDDDSSDQPVSCCTVS